MIMASTKSDIFPEEYIQFAKIAKALGHPARIAILKFLAKQNVCLCSCIVDEIPLSQSTVSQHLKELKEAGLIQGEINPPKIKYCINRDNWEKANILFKEFFDVSSPGEFCCK